MDREELQQLALLLQAQLDAKTPPGIKTRITVSTDGADLRVKGFDDGIYDSDLDLIREFGKQHGLERMWLGNLVYSSKPGQLLTSFEIHLFNGEK